MTHLRRVSVVVLLALVCAVPVLGQSEQGFRMEPLSSTSQRVDTGARVTLEVRVVDPQGVGVPGVPISWEVVSSPGSPSGPSGSPTATNGSGISRATFNFGSAGTTTIRASYRGLNSVTFTVRVAAPAVVLSLARVSPATTSVVLGDAATFEVRVTDQAGNPVAGVTPTWEVASAPGSPRGTSGAPTASDGSGVARATFGFGVDGTVVLRASLNGASPVLFTVNVGSLGSLTSDNNTRESAGGAFDDICREVFNNPDGTPKPTPRATPLCVFMVGVLGTHEQRAEALVEMSPTGLGSASKTAVAGAIQQQSIVASRLVALRSGAIAAGMQVSMTAGDRTIDRNALASIGNEAKRRESLSRSVDVAAGRGGSGRGRQSAAVTSEAPERDRRWGLFFTGRLQQGEQSGDVGDETGFDFDTTSGTLGLDFAVGANSFLGVAAGYATNQTDLAGRGGELEFDAQSLTLYGLWQGDGGGYFQASAAYGTTQYDQNRRIELPVVGNLDARADFDGDQTSATLETGWTWGGPRGSLTGFARGSWTRANVDAFAEEGAVANVVIGGVAVPTDFGVAVEEQELTSLLGEAGIDLAANYSFSTGVFVPQLTVAWRHEFDNDARSVRASFLGDQAAGSSFLVFLDDPDRDWIDAGVSLAAQYLWGSFFLSYDREFSRDDLELETWQAGLRFEF